MTAYLLVVILCPLGAPDCYAREFASFATMEACAAEAPASTVIAMQEYAEAWQQVTGGDPPPTQVTVGCREECST